MPAASDDEDPFREPFVCSRVSSSPYRNEIDALRERKATLESELARVRAHSTQLGAQADAIATELSDVEKKLGAANAKRALPLLDQVRVASPCDRDWNEMLGDDRVRYCLGCEKNVFNLSAMSREDAEQLLQERVGKDLCVRFYQRADGTILTEDCPVGVKRKRRKKLALAFAAAGATAMAATTLMMRTACKPMMGEPAVQQMAPSAVPTDEGHFVMGDVGPDEQVPVTGTTPPVTPPPPPPVLKMGKRK